MALLIYQRKSGKTFHPLNPLKTILHAHNSFYLSDNIHYTNAKGMLSHDKLNRWWFTEMASAYYTLPWIQSYITFTNLESLILGLYIYELDKRIKCSVVVKIYDGQAKVT